MRSCISYHAVVTERRSQCHVVPQFAEIIKNAAPLLCREVWMTEATGCAAERLIRQF